MTLSVTVGTSPSTTVFEVEEGESRVFDVSSDTTPVAITVEGTGTLLHAQLEEGEDITGADYTLAVGPTSHIVCTSGDDKTRALETLRYLVTTSDIDFSQGRLDLEVTPQMDGVRSETGSCGLAGTILEMSLVQRRDRVAGLQRRRACFYIAQGGTVEGRSNPGVPRGVAAGDSTVHGGHAASRGRLPYLPQHTVPNIPVYNLDLLGNLAYPTCRNNRP